MESLCEKILIVDDDPGVLSALQAELADHFCVTAVMSAEQALANLQTRDFAAIISDVRMPGVDGLRLLKQCAVRYPNMVRIILTAFDGDEVLETALGPHGAFKLVKPWGDDLLITLRNALAQRASAMTLRRHLDLKTELLDIDRRLHTELPLDELLAQAAREMLRSPQVTAAAIYLFDEKGLPEKPTVVQEDEDGAAPELHKTRSVPVHYKNRFLYTVLIGRWARPWAAIALELSKADKETTRYLDFIGRQTYKTLRLIRAGVTGDSDSAPAPACMTNPVAPQVTVNWIVRQLTTPTTVLATAVHSMKELADDLARESDSQDRTATAAEIRELADDLQTMSDQFLKILEHLRELDSTK